MAGNPFLTKLGNRLSCRDQEGRRGSDEVVLGPSVFPKREPSVSGNFGGSHEGCQVPFRTSGRNMGLPWRHRELRCSPGVRPVCWGTLGVPSWVPSSVLHFCRYVGLLLRRCGGQGAHAAKTMEPRGFSQLRRDSRVTTGISGFLLCRPWEAQTSIQVARESWGLRSSHCRAKETSSRRVSGT